MEIVLKNPIVFFDLETTGLSITKDRIVEISVNGDVSKNGNDGAYGSLDCGNYTTADLRLNPFSTPSVNLECILDNQQWEPTANPPNWGKIGENKKQDINISIELTSCLPWNSA